MKREHWDRKYAEKEQLWSREPNRPCRRGAARAGAGSRAGPRLRRGPTCGMARRARMAGYGRRLLGGGDSERARRVPHGKASTSTSGALDLLDFEPAPGAFDLVLVLFLQLPSDERQRVLARAQRHLRPAGRCCWSATTSRTGTRAWAGRATLTVLYTPEDIVAELPGSRSRRPSGCCATSTTPTGLRSTRSSERAVPRPRGRSPRTAPPRAGAGTPRTDRPSRRRPACLPAGRRRRAARR